MITVLLTLVAWHFHVQLLLSY